MPNENLWWYDPLERGARRGWDIVSGWGQRAGEAIGGLGETEDERRRRLQARSDAAARESYFKGYPHQQDVSQEQIFKDKIINISVLLAVFLFPRGMHSFITNFAPLYLSSMCISVRRQIYKV